MTCGVRGLANKHTMATRDMANCKCNHPVLDHVFSFHLFLPFLMALTFAITGSKKKSTFNCSGPVSKYRALIPKFIALTGSAVGCDADSSPLCLAPPSKLRHKFSVFIRHLFSFTYSVPYYTPFAIRLNSKSLIELQLYKGGHH